MAGRLLFMILYVGFSVYVSVLDIRHGEVSRVVLWLATVAALVLRLIIRGIAVLPVAAGGCVLGGGFFLLIFFCSRKKLGLADVWYAGLIGVVLGPFRWFGGIGLACILATGYCLIRGRRTIPFIPFMAAGGAAVLPPALLSGDVP